VCDDEVDGRGDAVDHDVDQQAELRRRRPTNDPRAAHLARRIVERGVTVAAPPDAPAEYRVVEGGRAIDVGCRDST
jgi:hypothetical protein